MWQRLAVVCFASAAVSLSTAQAAPRHPQETRVAGQDAGPTNSNAPRPVIVNVQTPATPAEKNASSEQENLDIQRKLAAFTFGLVIVGLLQVGTMIGQTLILWRTLGTVTRRLSG
jgi:hypothetical protein